MAAIQLTALSSTGLTLNITNNRNRSHGDSGWRLEDSNKSALDDFFSGFSKKTMSKKDGGGKSSEKVDELLNKVMSGGAESFDRKAFLDEFSKTDLGRSLSPNVNEEYADLVEIMAKALKDKKIDKNEAKEIKQGFKDVFTEMEFSKAKDNGATQNQIDKVRELIGKPAPSGADSASGKPEDLSSSDEESFKRLLAGMITKADGTGDGMDNVKLISQLAQQGGESMTSDLTDTSKKLGTWPQGGDFNITINISKDKISVSADGADGNRQYDKPMSEFMETSSGGNNGRNNLIPLQDYTALKLSNDVEGGKEKRSGDSGECSGGCSSTGPARSHDVSPGNGQGTPGVPAGSGGNPCEGGTLFAKICQLASDLVDNFEGYIDGLKGKEMDMKISMQFQTKLMQFVTVYGALNKGLQGGTKAMKACIDGIQP